MNVPWVIVEPGSTHEGQLEHCREHIANAMDSGAHAIKFQWLSDPKALAKKRNAANYLDAYAKISFPLRWHKELSNITRDCGMDYGCSVYLKEDVRKLAGYVDFFKVSSFECEDMDLIRCIHKSGKPLYVSLGMKDEEEAETLRQLIWAMDKPPRKFECTNFLYCVTGYPCPTDQLNLDILRSGAYEGFSDHSCDVTVGARAYAAGARTFEVHTKLDTTPFVNPDYAVALSYEELTEYIQLIHEQVRYSGSCTREIQPIEKTFLQYRSKRT
jgi:sialic acid synthase SpsE